jgi:hypothetical protein
VSRPAPANLLAIADLYGLDAGELLRMYADREPGGGKLPAAGGAPGRRANVAAAEAVARALAEAAQAMPRPPRRSRRNLGS